MIFRRYINSRPDRQTLETRVKKVRQRLDHYNIKINDDKYVRETRRVDWLGYEISGAGIRPTKSKTEIITKLKAPTNVKQVRQLMGIINYYAKFIKSLAGIASPIYNLLKKNVPFRWRNTETTALNLLKEQIRQRAPLAPFQTCTSKRVVLKCDACDTGIGAVLEQEQASGEMKPVLYWSSKLRDYEANYSIGEKEALACVAAVTKLRKYLLGRHFVLQTDHRALETLLSQSKVKRTMARVERWREKLSCYDYHIEHIRGVDNAIADILSRTASKSDHREIPLMEEIVINSIQSDPRKESTRYSHEFQELVQDIRDNNWTDKNKKKYKDYYVRRDKLTERNNFIFYNRTRFVPSPDKHKRILIEAHKLHQGITKTRTRIAEYFWWPGWSVDAERAVKECRECNLSDRTKKTPPAPLNPVPLPRGPWDKIAADIKGPINTGGSKYLLVIVDYYSKWPEVIGINSISSQTIINAFRKVFARFGLPRELVTDNGTQFVSREIETFLREISVNHRTVALYAPQQNGLVERFNRVLSEKIKEASRFKWNVRRTIESVLFHYRSTPHVTTNVSPFEAMFRRKMRNNLSNLFPNNEKSEPKTICPETVADKQKKMVEYHRAKKGAKVRPIKIGDTVRIRGPSNQFGGDEKVIKVGKSSVTTRDGRKWPMNKVWRGR